MSFGAQEYQHRFFRNDNHKKLSISNPLNNYSQPPISNVLPPIVNIPGYASGSSQPSPQMSRTKQINWNTRGGILKQNDMGWQGYRMKSYVTDQYAQNYQYNAFMLQKFKKEAEQYRRNVKFGPAHQRARYQQQLRNQAQMAKSLIYNNEYDQLLKDEQRRVSILNNPETIIQHYRNIDALSRLRKYELQREHEVSRLQQDNSHSNRKLRSYKKKYSKLKNKIKQQLLQKQKIQLQARQAKAEIALRKESTNLEAIQNIMSKITQGLQKNSQLLNQSLLIRQDMSNRSNIQPVKNKSVVIQPTKQRYGTRAVSSFDERQADAVSENEEDQRPKMSPKVQYVKKSLEKQYKQLENLKKEIQRVDNHIKRLRTE